eukprot:3941733-Rhodomonas_salina.1
MSIPIFTLFSSNLHTILCQPAPGSGKKCDPPSCIPHVRQISGSAPTSSKSTSLARLVQDPDRDPGSQVPATASIPILLTRFRLVFGAPAPRSHLRTLTGKVDVFRGYGFWTCRGLSKIDGLRRCCNLLRSAAAWSRSARQRRLSLSVALHKLLQPARVRGLAGCASILSVCASSFAL